GFVVTAAGAVVGFNLADFAAPVQTAFDPGAGAAVRAVGLDGGNLVVAEEGGAVELLRPDPVTGAYGVAGGVTPPGGCPPDPSALEVLRNGSELEALVASTGSDQVFVFGGLEGSPSFSPPPPQAGLEVAGLEVRSEGQPSSTPEAPLVLV